MTAFAKFSSIQQVLTSAQTILIVIPESVDFDKIAAGLSLYLSLKKAGKSAEIVAPQEPIVEFSSLVGIDKLKTKIGGKNLVISFDYTEDSIEKVSYDIEEGKFNLVVQPKEGFPALSPEKVVYSSSGAKSDLVFLLGINGLSDLGELYQKEKEFFDKSQVVAVDTRKKEIGIRAVDLLDEEASCFSEIIGSMIIGLKLPFDEDIAQNLLRGIENKTENFASAQVNADTFELAALCLRQGAKRSLAQGVVGQLKRRLFQPDAIFKPMAPEESANKAPASEEVDLEPPETFPVDEDFDVQPQSDWFSPKIYKGNTKI